MSDKSSPLSPQDKKQLKTLTRLRALRIEQAVIQKNQAERILQQAQLHLEQQQQMHIQVQSKARQDTRDAQAAVSEGLQSQQKVHAYFNRVELIQSEVQKQAQKVESAHSDLGQAKDHLTHFQVQLQHAMKREEKLKYFIQQMGEGESSS